MNFGTLSVVRSRSSLQISPDRFYSRLFLRRSPPTLLTPAARSGLEPAPDRRLRGTYPHLSCSFTPPYGWCIRGTRSGRAVSAKLAGRDPSTDIAVLRIEEGSSSTPQLGDSTSLKLGHLVLALGRTRHGDLVASSGIIGGISGEWRNRRGGQLDQHIRLDLALYPGFSGGPLLNARGEVVGINTRGLAHGRAVTVPVATVHRVVEELLKKGRIARPYLGIAMQPVEVPENMSSKLLTKTRAGLLVVHVENDGPAEQAGVLLGDVVFEVSGKTVEHMDAIQDSLATARVGDVLEVRIIRAAEIKPVSITLGERAR